MVLSTKNGNSKPRVSSNGQNIPPRTSASRSLAHRLRSSVEATRRYNRTNNARPTPTEAIPPIQVRKGKKKALTTEKPLSFEVSDIVHHVTDVEMGDATSPRKTRVTMSRELVRPQFDDINLKRIAEIDEQLIDVPLDVIRTTLDLFAPE